MNKLSAAIKQNGWLIAGIVLVAAVAAPAVFQMRVRHPAVSEPLPKAVSKIAKHRGRWSPGDPASGGKQVSQADGTGDQAASGSIENPSAGRIAPRFVPTAHDQLLVVALDDPDSSVRLGGIEAAVRERGEEAFDLLWEAVQLDRDADNRLSAVSELEQMLKQGLFDDESILELLNETSQDPDPRVADLSSLIIKERFEGKASMAEVEELPAAEETQPWQPEADPSESEATAASPEESMDVLWQLALDDPEPAVRLSGIEAAMRRPDAEAFNLLVEAAVYDSDPDNRLSAVGVLEDRLRSGFDNADETLDVLTKTSVDPDSRVAALSELVIEEYHRAQEARSVPGAAGDARDNGQGEDGR